MNKRIICFIDNLGSGGAQRQMVNLAVLLRECGYSMDFLVYGKNDFYQHILDKNHIQVHRITATNYMSRMYRVCTYLKMQNADAVIAFMETPGFLACIVKALGAKWCLITNELSAKESTFQGVKQRIYNWFERFSDVKVCNSCNAMELWKKHYPKYADKLRVIYNPVMIPALPARSEQTSKRLHILVAASYQGLKNPLGVINAINLLDDTEKQALQIDWYGRTEVTVGDTSVYEEACRRIEASRIQNIIILHSETKEIYPLMYAADVIGLFSTVEGLPNAICEGMMMGKPIVMTRVSDYEVLTDGNGLLCDPDPISIAEVLRKLLKLSKDDMARMGERSRQKATNLFDKENVIRQWIEVLTHE